MEFSNTQIVTAMAKHLSRHFTGQPCPRLRLPARLLFSWTSKGVLFGGAAPDTEVATGALSAFQQNFPELNLT